MGFLKFIWRHPISALLIVIGALMTIGGLISDAYSFYQLGLPPLVWSAIGALVFMCAIVVMLFRWEARLPMLAATQPATSAAQLETSLPRIPTTALRPNQIYDGAHQRLLEFVIDHLLPTIKKFECLRDEMVRGICANYLIAEFAQSGLRHDPYIGRLTKAVDALASPLGNSPIGFIPFEQMVESVWQIEIDYHLLPAQTERLRKTTVIADKANTHLGSKWREWRDAHVAMVEAYERIRRDPQMAKLFRPTQPQRFGTPMQVTNNGLPLNLSVYVPD